MTFVRKLFFILFAITFPALTNAQSYFTVGSTSDEVRKVQGTPDEVNRYSSYEIWDYGYSSVKLSSKSRKVLAWDNRGNLLVKLYPGYNVTSNHTFSQGSHKDDVLRLQGTPDEISQYSSYEIWDYDYSSIKISTRSENVLAWDNRGNLKIKMLRGHNTTTSRGFSQGSHKDDVLRLQGTPDEISQYSSYEIWDYGYSSVNISTQTDKVLEWDNEGDLKIQQNPGHYITDRKSFNQGSHKDDVLRLQGTPDEISQYSSYEIWDYGYSSVKISSRSKKVMEWENTGNLKVRIAPGRNVTQSQSFSRGSHKDDVLRLQGTPEEISRYSFSGYEIWDYGHSSVKISLANNVVVAYSNKGELKVKSNSYERKIKYHHKFDDITLYYDENKSFSNIISYETDDGEKIYGIIDNGITYLYDRKLKPLNMYAYYDTDKDLNVKSIDSSVDSYSIDGMRNRLRNIDFSGDISGSGTASRIGNMTFYDIMTDNGSYVHGSSIDMGSMSFDDFYTSEGVSYSGSRMRIGNFSFGDWSSFDGPDISGSSTRIGDMVFHDYTTSDGRTVSGTTMEIGDMTFTDFSEY